MSTLDIVAEWEECVRTQGYLGVLSYPLLLLLHSEHFGLLLEEHLPCAIAQYIVMIF